MADQIDDKTRKRDSRHKFNRRYEPYLKANPDRKCQADENQRTERVDGLLPSFEKKLTDKFFDEEHDKVDGQSSSRSHTKLKIEDYDELSTKELEEMFKKGLITKKQYEFLLKLNGVETDKADGLLSLNEKKLTDKFLDEEHDKVDGQSSSRSYTKLKIEDFDELSTKELEEMYKKGLITEKQYELLLKLNGVGTDKADGSFPSIEKNSTDKPLEEPRDKVDGQTSSKVCVGLKVEVCELSTKELEKMYKEGLITKKTYKLLLKLNDVETDKPDGLLSLIENKLTEPHEEAQDKVDGQTSFKSHEELKLDHYHELSIKELKEIFKKGLITKKHYKLLLKQCELVRRLYGKRRDQIDRSVNKQWKESTQEEMDEVCGIPKEENDLTDTDSDDEGCIRNKKKEDTNSIKPKTKEKE